MPYLIGVVGMFPTNRLRYIERNRDNVMLLGSGRNRIAAVVVPVRGAAVHGDMAERWDDVMRAAECPVNDLCYRDSYITLRSEPCNRHDPSAIKVLANGRSHGKLGYVDRSRTEDIRALSAMTGAAIGDLDCTVVNSGDVGWKSVYLLVTAPYKERAERS